MRSKILMHGTYALFTITSLYHPLLLIYKKIIWNMITRNLKWKRIKYISWIITLPSTHYGRINIICYSSYIFKEIIQNLDTKGNVFKVLIAWDLGNIMVEKIWTKNSFFLSFIRTRTLIWNGRAMKTKNCQLSVAM